MSAEQPSVSGKREDLFEFTDPREGKIYSLLGKHVSDGSAAFFETACRIIHRPTAYSASTNLISHLLREVESALRDVAESILESDDKRNQSWKDALKRKLMLFLSKFTTESGDQLNHKEEVNAILLALDIDPSEKVAKEWLALCGSQARKKSRSLHKRAHRRNLAYPKPLKKEFLSFWESMLDILLLVLGKLKTKFAIVISELDKLASIVNPTKDDAKKFLKNFPNTFVAHNHFLEKVNSPAWFRALKKAGLFDDPPEIDVYNNPIQWAASLYLVKMAETGSINEEVHATILDLLHVDNIAICANLLKAANALPTEMAADIAAKCPELRKKFQNYWINYEAVSLMEKMSKGKQPSVALSLTSDLLKVLPDSEGTGLILKPKLSIDDHLYADVIENKLEALVELTGFDAFEMLCEKLDQSLQFSYPKDEKDEGNDASYIWRHHIGGQESHIVREASSYLIDGVRDVAMQLCKQDPGALTKILTKLTQYKWSVFERISLYLLTEVPSAPRELVVEQLQDIELFDDANLRREYRNLVEEKADLLNDDEIAKIIEKIEAKPDIDVFKERVKRWEDREATNDEIEHYVATWQRERLMLFEEVLNDEWQEKLEQLNESLGELEPEEEPSHFAKAVGWKSELSDDELLAMTDKEIINYVKNWQPSGKWGDPDVEGLGRQIQRIVTAQPARFAKTANEFQVLDPVYVRPFVYGYWDAVKEGKKFDWEPLLDLFIWIVTQKREIEGYEPKDSDLDLDWGWTRMAIARVIRSGLQEGECELPLEMREKVWLILEKLADDPDPSVEEENKPQSNAIKDPYHIAINSVRSKTIEAAICYGLWLFRKWGMDPEDMTSREAGFFGKMPELQLLLEKHLDPNVDGSMAVRSIYGHWLPHIYLLDQNWVSKNLASIFPHESSLNNLRAAAWNTYVLANGLFNSVFPILKNEYLYSVKLLKGTNYRNKDFSNPSEHLAGHITMAYLRGFIGLDTEDGIIKSFFENAPDTLRGRMIGAVGQIMENEKNPNDELIRRTQVLWESRLHQAHKADDITPFRAELREFAWWVTSGKYKNKWLLTQLLEALEVADDIDVDYMVVEKLTEMTAEFPLECIRALKKIVEREGQSRWGIEGYIDEATKIIKLVCACNVSAAIATAKELISYFMSIGYIKEFKEMKDGDKEKDN